MWAIQAEESHDPAKIRLDEGCTLADNTYVETFLPRVDAGFFRF